MARTVPLAQSIWIETDVASDIRQTFAYYEYSHGRPNSSFSRLENQSFDTNGTDHLHQVSSYYFYFAIGIWVFTPLIFTVFYLGLYKKPFSVLNSYLDSLADFKFEVPGNLFIQILLAIACFPIDFLAAFVFIYIVIPYGSFKRSLMILMKKEFREFDGLALNINSNFLPFFKLFELLGEAAPQLCLAITFMANNYLFMQQETTLIELTVTKISMVFSTGSLIMGIYSSIPSLKLFLRIEHNNPHNNQQ